MTYLLANAYTIAGGLLGSPPGGEMRAAARAAEEVSGDLFRHQLLTYQAFRLLTVRGVADAGTAAQVGASVVLADRPQGVTMQRLARMAAPQQSAHGCSTGYVSVHQDVHVR